MTMDGNSFSCTWCKTLRNNYLFCKTLCNNYLFSPFIANILHLCSSSGGKNCLIDCWQLSLVLVSVQKIQYQQRHVGYCCKCKNIYQKYSGHIKDSNNCQIGIGKEWLSKTRKQSQSAFVLMQHLTYLYTVRHDLCFCISFCSPLIHFFFYFTCVIKSWISTYGRSELQGSLFLLQFGEQ